MIVAAVPVKRLSEAKSRLSHLLSDEERSALVLALLRRTIRALRESGMVERIVLATPDGELAERLETEWLPDGDSLNEALSAAVQWALRAGAGGLLIVPGDLPRITGQQAHELLAERRTIPSAAIASTQDGGTGALLLTPPDAIPPLFGPNSYERHLVLARLRTVAVQEVTLDAFTFDLDTPEDLDAARPYLRELALEA